MGENLIDHPEVPIIALANGAIGYHKQGVGWRMLLNGLQFKLFGTGTITSSGVEAGAFVNPLNPDGEPSIQAFCVPIVYLDRDTLNFVQDTYGLHDHHRRREAKIARDASGCGPPIPKTCRWCRPIC